MNNPYAIMAAWAVLLLILVYLLYRLIIVWQEQRRNDYVHRDDYTIYDFYLDKE